MTQRNEPHSNADAPNHAWRLDAVAQDAQRPLDADLVAVAAALDQDAALRRAEPPSAFEDRLAVGTFGTLAAARATAPVAGVIRPASSWPMRLAAAVALLAALGAAYLAHRTGEEADRLASGGSDRARPTPDAMPLDRAAPEDDWLTLAVMDEDQTAAEIDSLYHDAAALESSVRGLNSWARSGLEGGAM